MKKRVILAQLLSICLILVLVACAKPTPTPTLIPTTTPPLPARLEFATHSLGTLLNVVGAGLSKVASAHSGIAVTVVPTGGSSAWVPGMNSIGSPDIGVTNAFDLWQAYTGKIAPAPIPGDPRQKAPFTANQNLRTLAMGTNYYVGLIVKNDSPMKTLKDMRGKRLTWGFEAQVAAIPMTLAGLLNAGLTVNDVVLVMTPDAPSGCRAVVEGRADITNAAVGAAFLTEADASIGVRFLPWSEDPKDVKVAQAALPSGNVIKVKPGPAGLKVETPIWGYPITVASSTHMPNEVAYALVKAWWENCKELEPIHAQFIGWSPEVFIQKVATVPFHPGAIKFYKEKGVWGAEQDKMQEDLLKGELTFLK